ncbi:MAG: iron chelate uptake ABC transporter family permease subunit [Gemmatimonadetes bacterium]|jgi:iron complex transport system permease protein|nr:iron chelate uptake ABC transporter family permease subunit [Gemmatimonadota bacterium]MBT7863726.1 iron chelate uptake ABC transporter family permease subunit [Gemmatimonadota bacterium]
MNSSRRAVAWLPSLSLLLLFLCVLSLGTGPVSIPAADVVDLLFNGSGEEGTEGKLGDSDLDRRAALVIVRELRPPRILLAVLVGASLALSGAVMQGFFQNPMADPYIIGVSSGAALGATLALTMSINFWVAGLHSASIFAFAGALTVTLIVYTVSLRAGRVPATLLLLTGVAVGSMAGAATSFIMLSGDDTLHAVLYWILGSFSSRRWEHVHMVWPSLIVGIVVLQVHARDLNVLLQGEENAQYLGVDVERLKKIFLLLTALLTATAVSVSGIIGFVGLIVPHMMRLLVGPDHRVLFPASLLGGAILMVAADMLARTVAAPAEVPVGIVTALLGCPFFLYLLSRRRELAL